MSKLRNSGRTSSVISIWKAPAGKESADANEHKTAPTTVIGIEALRIINRIVWAIRERIRIREATTFGNDVQRCPTGDPSGSKTPDSNCSTAINGKEEGR